MAIKQRIDLQLLSECIVTEITWNRKKLYFFVLYRSHSQTVHQFHNVLAGVEALTSIIKAVKPRCLVISGDFNCRYSKWWTDENKNSEGIERNDLLTV